MKKMFITLIILLTASISFAGTGSYLNDTVLDAAATELATGVRLDAVSQIAGTYAQATSTYTLANKTVVAGDGNSFTIADGTTGRKVTVGATTSWTLTANGTATHMCISTASVLLGCWPMAVDKTIADYTTESWDASAWIAGTFADITIP